MNRPYPRSAVRGTPSAVCAAALCLVLSACSAPREPAASNSGGTREDYARAEALLPQNLTPQLHNLQIEPRWIEGGGGFWYLRTGAEGAQFIHVDVESGERAPAFDHAVLAQALGQAAGREIAATALPRDIAPREGGHVARVRLDDGGAWDCRLQPVACSAVPQAPSAPGEALSPDGRWAAYVRDFNLWLRDTATGRERALTDDGVAHHAYATVAEAQLNTISAAAGRPVWGDAHHRARVLWSPDSRRLLTYRVDEREVPELPFVDSLPDGVYGARPRLHTARVPFPGDQAAPVSELILFEAETGARTQVRAAPVYTSYDLIMTDKLGWSADGARAYFLGESRGMRRIGVSQIDPATGTVRELLVEEGKTWVAWPQNAPPGWISADGGQLFWLSERSGWQHLYRYDTATGKLLGALTSGEWRVDQVLRVDDAGQWVYFAGSGREPDRDVYYQHLYRVRFDGGEPELLTEEDAQHDVVFSPDGRYFIDRHSTVGEAPVTVLRRADGSRPVVLEQADIGALAAAGWQKPERFRAKGRDGATDIYGVIWRPAGFDPARKYPLLDNIYGGPQSIYAPRAFSPGPETTELGFIVVRIDGMGTPGRSKAFQDVSYGKGFAEAGGLEDHIAVIRELARRHPYIDLERVGIYGHSGGGYASARALFDHPDFFKAAVSSAGSHDQRIYQYDWGEIFIGLPAWDPEAYLLQSNVHDVSRLQGKLLLITGEMDDDVHPANTLQLADALMKANKDFDLMVVPGRNHRVDQDPYFVRRKWDYLVRHVMGTEPPAGYRVGAAR